MVDLKFKSQSTSFIILVLPMIIVFLAFLIIISHSNKKPTAAQSAAELDQGNHEELARRAARWEKEGEYVQAISCYLKITSDMTNERRFLEKVWMRAFELSGKFLPAKIARIAEVVAEKLAGIDRHTTAAKVYLEIDDAKNAIGVLVSGKEWNKAKKLAREMAPDVLSRVEAEHRAYLKETGNANELAGSDISSALEMYRERGQWDKCLETAKKHSNQMLSKYTAIYAAELIKSDRTKDALSLFIKYGPPVKDNALNIYRHIADQYFKHDVESNAQLEYERFAQLRRVMLTVLELLSQSGSQHQLEFDNLLLIIHYYALRAAMKTLTGLDTQIAKLSTSLLRHTEIVPADKAFYEAGMACRQAKKSEMAMIFMNRFLDLVEAIENDDGMLDPEGFEETEIPQEVPLPREVCLPSEQVEEIRNWVLNMSIDQRNLNTQLPLDRRGLFEGNLGPSGRPCVITGYAVFGQAQQFRRGRAANNGDWRQLVHQARQEPNQAIQETLQFIQKWAGEPTS